MSGGPGYVLTREAIRRFVEKGLGLGASDSTSESTNNTGVCTPGHKGLEDLNLGIAQSFRNFKRKKWNLITSRQVHGKIECHRRRFTRRKLNRAISAVEFGGHDMRSFEVHGGLVSTGLGLLLPQTSRLM